MDCSVKLVFSFQLTAESSAGVRKKEHEHNRELERAATQSLLRALSLFCVCFSLRLKEIREVVPLSACIFSLSPLMSFFFAVVVSEDCVV